MATLRSESSASFTRVRAGRYYVAGHGGLVGSAIMRRLQTAGAEQIITRARSELDLRDAGAVNRFFADTRPEYVFLAAARVGGILANDTQPGEFIRDNLLIQTHVIDAAWRCGARKLLFLGSSCIYPRHAPQPMREDCLMTGPLEPTNSAYAMAKLAGLEMCSAYRRQYGFNAIAIMPTNLYGPEDNFDLDSSHALPALIRKFHEAKLQNRPHVEVWGSGAPRREFLHSDDLADAAVFLMERYDEPQIINVGVGEDVSIAELADIVRDVVGYRGEIRFDRSKPDGTPRKLPDVSRLAGLGWNARIPIRQGIADTYRWYQAHGGGVGAACG
jgi:GDP-L-fucose synthase